MEIDLTPELIEAGRPRDLHSCPVALVLQASLGLPDLDVEVGAIWITLWLDGTETRIDLPEELRRWIQQYDLQKTNQPAKFFLEIPEELKRYLR